MFAPGFTCVLRGIHREPFLQVLHTPVRQVVADGAPSGGPGKDGAENLLESLVHNSGSLVPLEIGGCVVHFKSIGAALLLQRAQT